MDKTNIQKEIEETIAKLVHLDVVAAQLDSSKADLERQYGQYEEMQQTMTKELKDITKLEGLSTKAIFHKILGNKEQQLEKERQEYLELTLKFEGVQKNIELLEYEVNLLEAKIGNREAMLATLTQLKNRREQEIINTNPILRQKMLSLSHQLEQAYQFKKELQEAIEEGNICHNLLSQIMSQLQKVRNWGAYNSNRRGQMNRMIRRDAIDRARNLSYQVRHHLNLFNRELQDIGKRADLTMDESHLENFTGFFFNNIITDWILQQKLTQALGSINRTKAEVARIVSHLKRDEIQTNGNIEQLQSDREKILLQ